MWCTKLMLVILKVVFACCSFMLSAYLSCVYFQWSLATFLSFNRLKRVVYESGEAPRYEATLPYCTVLRQTVDTVRWKRSDGRESTRGLRSRLLAEGKNVALENEGPGWRLKNLRSLWERIRENLFDPTLIYIFKHLVRAIMILKLCFKRSIKLWAWLLVRASPGVLSIVQYYSALHSRTNHR